MPISAQSQAARRAAEAVKERKKAARQQKKAQAAQLSTTVEQAFARARVPFSSRLRDALAPAVTKGEALAASFAHFWPVVGALRALHTTAPGDVEAALDFVVDVEARCPGLLLVPLGPRRVLGCAVVALWTTRDVFVRPLSTFAPKPRGPVAQWDALVAHTCFAFPQPPLLEACFLDATLTVAQRRIAARVGAGASWRKVGAGATLTKAAAHLLSTSTERFTSLATAIRWAQARAAGVTPQQWHALRAAHPAWSLDNAREEVWLAFFDWLTRNPIAAADCDAVCDFVADRDVDFAFKGRTAAALVARAKQAVHERTLRERGRLDVGALPKVDVDGGAYRLLREDGSLFAHRFEISQIVDGQDLVDEGIAMRHCVGTYAERAKAGEVALFAVRRTEPGDDRPRRLLTVEVDPRTRSVEQVRGKCNRDATADERAVIAAWAKERALVVDAYAY